MAIDVVDPERRFDDPGETLASVGESGLLDALREVAGVPDDDAATWAPSAGTDIAVSIDALVEDVDFRRTWITPYRLGRRSFAVAASDLAATGAVPRRVLATVCAAGDETVESLVGIQQGLCDAAAEHGCAVAGGDVSAIDGPLVIDICVVGEVGHGVSLRRDAGQPGDILVVTGSLGRASAGLRILLAGASPHGAVEESWVDAQLQPTPRLREGAALAAAGVACAGDVSDGLAVDAARTARASGCGAELWVDALPVDDELRERHGREWLHHAVAGGEDFELLAAVAAGSLAALQDGWPPQLAPLRAVGRLVAGEGLRLLDHRGGAEVPVPAPRSRHFSGPRT